MKAKAFVRTIMMSPRKMRVVANMVRGQRIDAALLALEFMPKKAARIIAKAVKSAAANAEELSGGSVNVDALRISHISVDGGPTIKRWMPRAMGRANHIHHRTSHLNVEVSGEV